MPLQFEEIVTQKLDDIVQQLSSLSVSQTEIADRVSKLENKRAAEQPVVQDSAQDLSQDNVVQDGGAEADGVRQM